MFRHQSHLRDGRSLTRQSAAHVRIAVCLTLAYTGGRSVVITIAVAVESFSKTLLFYPTTIGTVTANSIVYNAVLAGWTVSWCHLNLPSCFGIWRNSLRITPTAKSSTAIMENFMPKAAKDQESSTGDSKFFVSTQNRNVRFSAK
jgi:hypothetical protein